MLLLGEVASWSWVWSLVAPEVWPWTLDCPPDCVALSVVEAWVLPFAADWPVVAVLDEASLPEVAPPVAAASLPEVAALVDAVLLLVEPAAPVEVDAPPVVAALPPLEPAVWLLPAAWVAEEACSELEGACVEVSLPACPVVAA